MISTMDAIYFELATDLAVGIVLVLVILILSYGIRYRDVHHLMGLLIAVSSTIAVMSSYSFGAGIMVGLLFSLIIMFVASQNNKKVEQC